jgi:phage terminase large subunit-like protein
LIASAPRSSQSAFLKTLNEEALVALPYLFDFWAMPHQVPPTMDWRTWVILGGRGAGKTRAGAEWVRGIVEGVTPSAAGVKGRIGLIAETY